jgi:regulator of protease activity HflC (stomatin/prohibitin superfamily)
MKHLLILVVAVLISGCHSVTTEPGHESVIVDNPWFFGHGGVRDETQKPGLSWYWWSTTSTQVPLTPIKYDEPLDHLATADNNFINYNSYIVLQWQDPAYHVKTFGYEKWYEHNLKEQYRTIVRDVTKKYQMTAIMIDPGTLASIEADIAGQFRKHIESTGLHVKLLNVNMGKALPDKPVIDEMNNTAAQQQRRKTEDQRKLAEDARRAAETARASADNAYRNAMQLNPAQFVQLEGIKRYADACSKASCTIIQGSVPVVVGK